MKNAEPTGKGGISRIEASAIFAGIFTVATIGMLGTAIFSGIVSEHDRIRSDHATIENLVQAVKKICLKEQ